MYESHFGLSKPPFRITPDPEFFFPGGNRGAVLEALTYAVARGEGIVKVVGEVGSGKTMLCRMLERELPASCDIIYLANPRLDADEILHAVAFELGLEVGVGEPRLKVMRVVQDYLLARHAENRRVVVFVEEAQGMPLESLEELRMLTNLETTQDKLLQIVLFGQPELDEKLDRHEIRQLRERITHSFDLAPLDRTEIRDYVNSRVRASGYRGNDLFDGGAIAEVERHSAGLLRRINVLADKALLAAFAASDKAVKAVHVRLAARDSEFGATTGTRRYAKPLLAFGIGVALIAVLVTAGGYFLNGKRENVPVEAANAPVPAPAPIEPVMLESEAATAADSASRATAVPDEMRLPPAILPFPRVGSDGYVSDAHLGPHLRLESGAPPDVGATFGNEQEEGQ